MPAPTSIHSTTQQFLDIYDIASDLVIMKDGAVSLILSVNAINFGLFAEEEQDAVIYAYAGLLNSLNYPIQIVIRSQTKDVTSYLGLLKEQEDTAASQLKKEQIRQYREFVADLIRERNVLDKKFYVIIPANALEMGLLPPQSVIPGVKKTDVSTVERSVIIDKAKNILEPKRDHLIGQFNRIGLLARQLTTQEIIQLFYVSYNPEAAEGQQITDTSSYTTSLVSAQVQANAMLAPPPTSQVELGQAHAPVVPSIQPAQPQTWQQPVYNQLPPVEAPQAVFVEPTLVLPTAPTPEVAPAGIPPLVVSTPPPLSNEPPALPETPPEIMPPIAEIQ